VSWRKESCKYYEFSSLKQSDSRAYFNSKTKFLLISGASLPGAFWILEFLACLLQKSKGKATGFVIVRKVRAPGGLGSYPYLFGDRSQNQYFKKQGGVVPWEEKLPLWA
jgi:hypothetical protein